MEWTWALLAAGSGGLSLAGLLAHVRQQRTHELSCSRCGAPSPATQYVEPQTFRCSACGHSFPTPPPVTGSG